jgi:hypothetical protein
METTPASSDVEAALAEMRVLAAEMRLRERALLDRLDVFNALLHARIDRELGDRRPALAVEAAVPPADRKFGPESIAGTGFHQVERDGGRSWRWFSPRVTLLLRDVAPGVRELRLDFPGLASQIDAAGVRIAVNALPVPVKIERRENVGTLVADLEGVPWAGVAGRPATLLVALQFDHKQPPSSQDTRELSATFGGGGIRY